MTNLKKNLFAAVLLATSTMAVSAQPDTSAVSASAAASSSIDKTRAEVRAEYALHLPHYSSAARFMAKSWSWVFHGNSASISSTVVASGRRSTTNRSHA